jgi:hypothetical protein
MERLNTFFATYVNELNLTPSPGCSYCRLSRTIDDHRRLRCALDAIGHDSTDLTIAIAGYDQAVARLYEATEIARDRIVQHGVVEIEPKHKKAD